MLLALTFAASHYCPETASLLLALLASQLPSLQGGGARVPLQRWAHLSPQPCGSQIEAHNIAFCTLLMIELLGNLVHIFHGDRDSLCVMLNP